MEAGYTGKNRSQTTSLYQNGKDKVVLADQKRHDSRVMWNYRRLIGVPLEAAATRKENAIKRLGLPESGRVHRELVDCSPQSSRMVYFAINIEDGQFLRDEQKCRLSILAIQNLPSLSSHPSQNLKSQA